MSVLRIEGMVSGEPTPYDGTYLVRFDFEGCDLEECNLFTTDNPADALQFDDAIAALDFWQQVDPRQPVRLDGLPNRPLTVFSVSIE